MQITNNFSLREFLYPDKMPVELRLLNQGIFDFWRDYKHEQRSEFDYAFYGYESLDQVIMEKTDEEIIRNAHAVLSQIQVVRDYFKKPVIVTCGLRTKTWDISRGRSGNSQHCEAQAADFYVKGVDLEEVYKFCKTIFHGGGLAINRAAGFIHRDMRHTSNLITWNY
jgi:uncharacterized protein YcbK (DUF882 family)